MWADYDAKGAGNLEWRFRAEQYKFAGHFLPSLVLHLLPRVVSRRGRPPSEFAKFEIWKFVSIDDLRRILQLNLRPLPLMNTMNYVKLIYVKYGYKSQICLSSKHLWSKFPLNLLILTS